MRELLHDELFNLGTTESSPKVMPLKDAVNQLVRPGMLIHTGQTSIRWCSAIYYEIARKFWGKGGDLTMVGVSMNFPQSILVHGGIVKKIITSYFGDPYFIPSPNRIFLRAAKEGTLEIENWSIYTIPLRFKAAALGVPFLPTHSLIGSDMEKENKDDFLVIDDPFKSGQKIGLVKALQPDLTVVHAWMADADGNAVFAPPLADNMYGAMASKEGVLLTAEKIVPTEVIRKYSHMMGLPGVYVRSVSEVPFGAHPSGLSNVGLDWMPLYAEDYRFVEDVHQASKDPDAFQMWVEEWVLSCKDHEDYLEKLGLDRILQLKGQSHSDSWCFDLETVEKVPDTEDYTPIEMAVVAMNRKLKEKIINNDYKTLLAGAGIANLGAWLSYYMLEDEGRTVELMAEVGMYGYAPRPTEPFLFGLRNFLTCKKGTDVHHILGIFVGGINGSCIGALGVGQVDEHGNINTTKMAEDRYIVGSGGANDVASRAKEVVAIVIQGKSRMPKDVYYVTSPGERVTAVVTNYGVFEKIKSNKTFTLTGYYPIEGKSMEEILEMIRERCEWSFDIADDLEKIAPPTKRELDIIRIFDTHRYYLGPSPDEEK